MPDTTYWECYFNNNPDSLGELSEIVAPEVLTLISGGPIIETPGGVVDGANTTFTLSSVPSPLGSLILTIIDGSAFTPQTITVDFNFAVIANVATIEMTVAPSGTETLQAYYYVL